MTIELGFARLALGPFHLGIVDVPGHERFVRHMVAGATGMDLVLLVVAADDSVKPQTREHLQVLRTMDLPAGVIALTKCDLVDQARLSLVEAEVRELVAGSFLQDSPVVPTSFVTGAGLDALRRALQEAAQRACRHERMRRVDTPFRLAIDRVFTVAGHGTIVTGSIGSGRVERGDRLTLYPGGDEVRVRGIHRHDQPVERAQRGQRAALNLAHAARTPVCRGQELAEPGYLRPSRKLLVELALPEGPHRLRPNSHVRLHVGTAEVMATLQWLAPLAGDAPPRGAAQLLLAEPVVTAWDQPLVLRSESPVTTVAGGRVRVPCPPSIRRPDATTLDQLARLALADPVERSAAAVYFFATLDWQAQDLRRAAGVLDAEAICRQLVEHQWMVPLILSAHRTAHLHRLRVAQWERRAVSTLQQWHAREPLQRGFAAVRLAERLSRDASQRGSGDRRADVAEAIVQRLVATGTIRSTEEGIGLPQRGPQLSNHQQRVLRQLVQWHRQAGMRPPTVAQCRQQATAHHGAVTQLLAAAADTGELVAIAPEFYLHADAERRMRQQVREALAMSPAGLTVSDIRSLLDTSRKYAVPMCEYLDALGLTVRQGDRRVLPCGAPGESERKR